MINIITGNIIAPNGFKAGSVHCGLKSNTRKHDIGIIFSEQPCKAAALFTTNQIVAAPIKLSRDIVKNGKAHAIVVNSGNANACTGFRGVEDCDALIFRLAEELSISPQEILIASTGIIGVPLPSKKILKALPTLSEELSVNGWSRSAEAIMTTDLVAKSASLSYKTGKSKITIGGIAKGSGMIHPNMATMLGYISCDAGVPVEVWKDMVNRVVEKSFNSITVDGDTRDRKSVV